MARESRHHIEQRVTCKYCGNELTGRSIKYRSKKCRDMWWNDSRPRFSKKKNCIICGVVFLGTGNHKTCSQECSNKLAERKTTSEYKKQHTNFDNLKKYSKKHYQNNAEKIKTYAKNQYSKQKGTKEYKEKCRLYMLKKRREDENYRIYSNIRHRIGTVLKRVKAVKSLKTENLVGCTIEELKKHLQQTAIDNGYLNFDINNYSGFDYHIDHIIPCICFNLLDKEEQKKCFHYTNMQILTAEENLKKHVKLVA